MLSSESQHDVPARDERVPARDERAAQAGSVPRTGRRIIAAERLAGFAPFTLDELSRDSTAPSPGRQAFEAPGADVRGPADDPFERFDSDAGTDPLGRERFEAGYRAGRETGYAEGLERGYAAGVERAGHQQREAEQQAGAVLSARIASLQVALEAEFQQVERSAADQVVTLALELARHALRATLAVRPETIVPVVQEALSDLFDERVRVHLHLNPRDAGLVRAELGERLDARHCEIVADASIEPGGCRARTARAEIDATVATRWRRTLAAIGRDADGSLAGHAEAGP